MKIAPSIPLTRRRFVTLSTVAGASLASLLGGCIATKSESVPKPAESIQSSRLPNDGSYTAVIDSVNLFRPVYCDKYLDYSVFTVSYTWTNVSNETRRTPVLNLVAAQNGIQLKTDIYGPDEEMGTSPSNNVLPGYSDTSWECFRLNDETTPVVVSMSDSKTGALIIEPTTFEIA